ncbi:hypothetical protein ACP4OV_008925 [Aristida adscensionis]
MAKAATLLFFFGALPRLSCKPSEINVKSTKTGVSFRGNPVWNMSVETECECPMFGANLACEGLERSAMLLDVSKIKQYGKEFYLEHGISKLHSNTFEYALDEPVNCTVISAQSATAC